MDFLSEKGFGGEMDVLSEKGFRGGMEWNGNFEILTCMIFGQMVLKRHTDMSQNPRFQVHRM